MKTLSLVLILFVASSALAVTGPERFAPMAWLEGEWQGLGQFPDRRNVAHKIFRYEMAGRYFVEYGRATFPPADDSLEFETHQDMVIYHTSGEGLAAKGFYVEGFVNHYTVSVEGDTLTLEATAVENAPPGTRARIRYWPIGEDRAGSTFDLAWPGKDWACYEHLELKRID